MTWGRLADGKSYSGSEELRAVAQAVRIGLVLRAEFMGASSLNRRIFIIWRHLRIYFFKKELFEGGFLPITDVLWQMKRS